MNNELIISAIKSAITQERSAKYSKQRQPLALCQTRTGPTFALTSVFAKTLPNETTNMMVLSALSEDG